MANLDVYGIIYSWDLATVEDYPKNNSYISQHLLPSMNCNLYDQMQSVYLYLEQPDKIETGGILQNSK